MKSLFILSSFALILTGCNGSEFHKKSDSDFTYGNSATDNEALMSEQFDGAPEDESLEGEEPGSDEDVIVIIDEGDSNIPSQEPKPEPELVAGQLPVLTPEPPSCQDATDGQSCMDLKCQPVTEDDVYVSCVPSTPIGKPTMTISQIMKDCSNLPPEASVPGKSKKAIICHQMGNGGYKTIMIGCPAVKAHVDHHNDTVGACQSNL